MNSNDGMSIYDPIGILFGGMEKLGPGDNAHTLRALRLLPKGQFNVVVDAGCGAGRQTLALAKELCVPIDAVDSYKPFLSDLSRRAAEAGVHSLVRTHCMDMKDIPSIFRGIELLWSEGAAYNIGFANALCTWAPAIASNGFAVVSELCWLKPQAPAAATEFFSACYPDMRSIEQNLTIAEDAGFRVLATHTLPKEAWVEGYYDILERRAKALITHPDSSVRDFAAETIKEIEIFAISDESYGYVFFSMQRA
ncbi:MAG: SAM-dependent methyltransferase [Deltaproteobacteria bacterium]